MVIEGRERPRRAPSQCAAGSAGRHDRRAAGTRFGGVVLLAVALLTACAGGPSSARPGTSAASGSAATSGTPAVRTAPSPTPSASDPPCWNGAQKTAGACPALTGKPALLWAFTLDDGPQCTRIGSWDPQRISLEYQCIWSDLAHTSAYLMQYTSEGDGRGFVTDSLAGKYKGMTPVDLHLDGDSGPSAAMKWSGSHGTGSNGHRQDDTVVVYDSIPFGLWLGTDLTQGGTDGDHAKAAGRIKFRTAAAVADVLDSTGG